MKSDAIDPGHELGTTTEREESPPIEGRWHIADMTPRVAWCAAFEDGGQHEELGSMTLPGGKAWLVVSVPRDAVSTLVSGEPVSVSVRLRMGDGEG